MQQSKLVSVLVTGGAGFIGSHLCRELLRRGHRVFCVDNLITGNRQNVIDLLANNQFTFFNHDITKPLPDDFEKSLSSLSYLYHLASPASPPAYLKFSVETLLVNSIGTYNMLELAREKNARFLLASTSEVYGNPKEHPQKESYYGHVNPIGLRACYDEGKRFAEALSMEYLRKYSLDMRIARIFNTYGPNMRPDDGRVISNMIVAAVANNPLTVYGTGEQTRSFCFVSDLVEGLIRLMETTRTQGEVVNLGNPQEYKINRLARIILDVVGSNSFITHTRERLPDDPDRRKPDIAKAQKLLSWEPTVSLREGIKRTAEYFKQL